MLINDFYTCHDVVPGEHTLSCRVVFNADHGIFAGHFPGQPVVPGVCMLEIVKELLQGQLNKTLLLINARNVKFLKFVTPDMQPAVQITWKESNAAYIVTASFSFGDVILFKLDGTYEAMISAT